MEVGGAPTKSRRSIFVAVLVLFVLVGSMGLVMTQGDSAYASRQATRPLALHAGPVSNAIPNGDFEDSRVTGSGGSAVPYGWTAENHGGSVDSRNTNIDSFKGSRCWEMSTAGNGWKNIWYYFDGAGAPDNLTLAIKIAQGQNDNDIIEIKMNDLTASLQLMYEFGHGSLQCWTNITSRRVIHEGVNYGVWYNLTKLWKADWQSAYGSPADMSHYWALLLGINTYYVSDTMVARYDSVWMENSTHPQYSPSPELNFGFEDPRVHSGGAYSYPYGWTTQNNGGTVDSNNTAADSFEGSRCWQMSSGPGSGWKNIWYYFNGTGIPDVCAFAVKVVQAQSSADIIQVKIDDLSIDVELIYEFSLGTQQVVANSTYLKNIHERINAGSWYNETKQWKTDWQRAYGSPADMNHYWALLLAVGTPSGSDQMIARFDAISLYNTPPAVDAITNGNFETGDFSGWIVVNHPIIDYNANEIYNGSYSAMNNHYYDYFYQPLNFTISDRSVFSSAVFATVMVSDNDWHEIQLTITKPGLTTINLHYRVQSTQPSDTATDKYFLIGKDVQQWFAVNRPVKNDLVYKGAAQYLGGTVTNITCQQGGVCCTVYDSLRLMDYYPSDTAGNAIFNGDFEMENFSGWTTGYHPIIDYNIGEVYHGLYSAQNNHYYDFFYQPLNLNLSYKSTFSGAMFATVSLSDSNWHEILLTVTRAGLGTIYLHYRLQSTQPSDTGTDKYFLIGTSIRQWYFLNRALSDDLLAKGATNYMNGTVTEITCQQGGVCCTVYDTLKLVGGSQHASPSNSIINGNFETDDFAGWTIVNHPLVADADDWVPKYEGSCSGLNNHYYDCFCQTLSCAISSETRFKGAMYAIVAISDYDWHETRLAITMPGLPTLYLHYRLQSYQPVDTSTDKYFLIGTQLERWYSWDHNLYSDLSEKGVAQYMNGTVTEIMCQQGGVCCTAYDAFELSPSSGSGTRIDSPVFPFVIFGIAGLFTLVAIAAAVSLRSRGSREYGNAPTEPEGIGGDFDEEPSSRERSTSIPSTEKCPRCGASVASYDASYCTNCGTRLGALSQSNAASPMRRKPVAIGTCMVCGLKLDDSAVVAKCPNCGSIGHRVHVLEWLHVKGYCPACGRHLDERDLKN